MRTTWRLLALTAVLAAAVQALAVSEQPPPEDPQAIEEQNRRLLEKWRGDPDHYARLKRDGKAFFEMSAESQDRLRQFDRDLHAEDSTTQARLWAVLDRYFTWLEKLPKGDRAWIEAAPDATERLERVKVIRDRQWVARLPQKTQEELAKLPDTKRPERVAELRRDERQRRLGWFWASHERDGEALKRARPTRLSEFPPEVQHYYKASISHLLSDADLKHLDHAEGTWPLYARTLAKVMELPPPELPGHLNVPVWPTRLRDLPPEWRRALLPIQQDKAAAIKGKKDEWKALQGKADKWPDYAIAVTNFVRAKKLKVEGQLGPSKPEQFSMPVQQFIKNDLLPKLSDAEKADLNSAEGKWPEYPQGLLEKARKHGLTMPATVRPGSKEFWESMSKMLPDVPDRSLRIFALTELTPEERGKMNLSPDDDALSREQLIKAYWDRHLDQLERQLRPHRPKPRRQ